MADRASEDGVLTRGVKAAAPWRKGVAWWLVVLEGLILLGVGLYMLIAEESTEVLLGVVLSATLAVMGLLELISGLRSREIEGKVARWTVFQGAVGLVVGAVVFGLLVGDSLSSGAGRTILGIGCLVFGLLGIYRYFLQRHRKLPRSGIIMGLFFFVVGLFLVLAVAGIDTVDTSLLVISIVLVVGGVALIGWGAWLFRRRRRLAAAG
jgi:uncharacterized membrane protein HdeD (DUF308 family)